MPTRSFLGVFLNLVYERHHGINVVLDRLQDTGVDAIVFFPMLARPIAGPQEKRFPDMHIDGHRPPAVGQARVMTQQHLIDCLRDDQPFETSGNETITTMAQV